jgi:Type I phosphodiesterase / nucleotide pyrophosphatase
VVATDLLTQAPIENVTVTQTAHGLWRRLTVSAPEYRPYRYWTDEPDHAPERFVLAPTDPATYEAVAWKNPTGPRVILLELDSLTPRLVKRFMAEGRLPALAVLFDHGAHGPLASCCGLSSPSVWTTVHTGLLPEEHGVTEHLGRDDATGRQYSHRAATIKAPRLWDLLRAQNRRAIVWGAMLPGDHADDLSRCDRTPGRFADLRAALPGEPVDLLVVYDPAADMSGHHWYAAFDPEPFRKSGWDLPEDFVAFNGEQLAAAYEEADMWVGLALQLAGPNTTIVAVSDHGMGGMPQMAQVRFRLADFLAASPEAFAGLTDCQTGAKNTVDICGDSAAGERAARALRETRLADGSPLFDRVRQRGASDFGEVDSAAVAVRFSVNEAALLQPANRNGNVMVAGKRVPAATFLSVGGLSGDHTPFGIFAVGGPLVNRQATFDNPSVFDVAPTVLYSLGMPVGRDMPGQVWDAVLEVGRAVAYRASYGRRQPSARFAVEPAELEHLRSLGYLR